MGRRGGEQGWPRPFSSPVLLCCLNFFVFDLFCREKYLSWREMFLFFFFYMMRPHRVENEIHPRAPASLQKVLPKTQATEAPSADTYEGLLHAGHWAKRFGCQTARSC